VRVILKTLCVELFVNAFTILLKKIEKMKTLAKKSIVSDSETRMGPEFLTSQ
jgi:hypothetical protein